MTFARNLHLGHSFSTHFSTRLMDLLAVYLDLKWPSLGCAKSSCGWSFVALVYSAPCNAVEPYQFKEKFSTRCTKTLQPIENGFQDPGMLQAFKGSPWKTAQQSFLVCLKTLVDNQGTNSQWDPVRFCPSYQGYDQYWIH